VATVERTSGRRRAQLSRGAFTCLGVLFLVLGVIGLFVPVWPTTIFLILAAWAFKRGCEPLERWLLEHPRLGPPLRDWQEHRSIRLRTKWLAVLTIWLSILTSCVFVSRATSVVLIMIGLALTTYLLTRKTTTEPARTST
jgi:uncharacterized membrane protein YbaN (DUF454 family)